jgi:hypothetical protein
MLSSDTDLPQRDRWARLRFAIIGPLLAAPPAAGDLHHALKVLAAKAWRHPFTGLEIRFAVSTIERWLYAAKKAADPVQALRNQVRRDIGRFPSLSAEAVQVLTALYREHPGWTAQLLHDNLRVTLGATATKCPSYPSVRRYLKAQGLVRRRAPKRSTEGALAARDRLEQREVRSYEVEHVLQLLHLDFHHGSRKVLTRSGAWVKPLLVGFIDDRSRFLCHAQWYVSEGTEELVHGLCQALQLSGLPKIGSLVSTTCSSSRRPSAPPAVSSERSHSNTRCCQRSPCCSNRAKSPSRVTQVHPSDIARAACCASATKLPVAEVARQSRTVSPRCVSEGIAVRHRGWVVICSMNARATGSGVGSS